MKSVSNLRVAFLTVCSIAVVLQCGAVTYDENLKPEQLAKLAERKEFQSACMVNGASGVLIAPNAVLTARHVIQREMAKNWVKLDGKKLEIAAIKIHQKADIAVILLKDAVKGIEPTPIYRGDKEVGMVVWKVGFGQWAPLVEGHREMLKYDLIARAITNNVDGATEDELHYRYESKGKGHTEYEGGTAPGDSGGPLYAEVEGKWVVTGVTSGPRKGFYADGRASTKAEWIDAAISGKD